MKLIPTKEYLLLIDEEAKTIKDTSLFFWCLNAQIYQSVAVIHDKVYSTKDQHKLSDCKQILGYYPLTKEAKKLSIPKLPNPFIKIDIEDLAEKYSWKVISKFSIPISTNELVNASKRDFIAGYIAAQSKQFNLEDIRNAMRESVEHWECEGWVDEEQIIKSLSTQQLPKEFIPIIIASGPQPFGSEKMWEKRELKIIINSDGEEELVGEYK